MKVKTIWMPITILLGFVISFILIYFPKQLLKDFTPLGVLGLWIIVVLILVPRRAKKGR